MTTLVEAMAKAISGGQCGGPIYEIQALDALQAMLAAVGLTQDALIYVAAVIDDTDNHDDEGRAACTAVSSLLRALAEAAPQLVPR
jgi:enamine deaminase RidA (YjgF/YER057c/UK114 family)